MEEGEENLRNKQILTHSIGEWCDIALPLWNLPEGLNLSANALQYMAWLGLNSLMHNFESHLGIILIVVYTCFN